MSFLLRETWRILSHIRGKLLLVIVLLALSGLLAGMLFLLYYNSSVIHHSFQRHLQGELFLQDDCSELALRNIRERLESDTLLAIDHFRSREEARGLFAAEFGDEVFEVLDENPLPASFIFHFRVSLETEELQESLIAEYESLPGVLALRVPSRMLRLLHQRITIILQISGGILLLLLAGTTLLVMYSTRQAVAHYWPEIDTMQLMGAGNWQIRRPFLAGTLIYTLLSYAGGYLLLLVLLMIADNLGYHLYAGGVAWVALLLLLLIGFGGTLPALNAGLKRKQLS